GGEHPKHQPGEVLFHRDEGRHWFAGPSSTAGGRPAASRTPAGWRTARSRPAPSGARRRHLDQTVAAEPARSRVRVLRRDLIFADELVGQLAVDLELDGHEIV